MKTLAIIAALILAAAAAQAAPKVVWQDGTVRSYWPGTIEWPDGQETTGANIEQCIATGIARWETAEETATREAAEAQAAQEAAEQAALMATLPATFPTGIAVTNEAGHWVEFIPDGTNVVCETLAIQISQSPLTPEQRNQMRQDAVAARSAKQAKAKAAKKNGKLQDRIAALEALLGVE